ncbi:hypothetical protein CDL15_Pgr027448 [Punica granatum]|nr:hypothetical protein CDL15_Pgr027448 [Punica granatum]PKI69923.1 hypothetical protein CRG98_009798 [Punica granatum]
MATFTSGYAAADDNRFRYRSRGSSQRCDDKRCVHGFPPKDVLMEHSFEQDYYTASSSDLHHGPGRWTILPRISWNGEKHVD